MPDILDANGLQVETLPEIVADLTTGLQGIYGPDINVDSNSPDGQSINIYGQGAADIRELILGVYNSFDPDRAIGVQLDERCAINRIQRNGGTYTIQPVDITVNATTSLQGLDANFNNPNGVGFTVQDDAGNKFILIDSVTLTSGTQSLNFRAQMIGQVETIVNTIVNQTTVVLGVTTVNNSSAALEVGENEETDAQFRLRRQQSVSNNSTGYLNGLEGDLLGLDGVTDAKVYENRGDTIDGDGIPAHGTWSIVEGGANSDIAGTIYADKSYGSNLKGAVSVSITTPAGAIFTAQFDRPSPENLYIQFQIQPTINTAVFNDALIKQYIVDNLSYKIGQFAETSSITAIALAAINANGGGGVPVEVKISSDDATWVDYLETSTLDKQFVIDVSRIDITDL